jgi:rod shape determining protein RodA
MSQRNPTISKGVDWSLVWIWFILCSIGITSIFAASWHEGDNIVQGFISLKTDYSRQLLFFIIAGIVGTFILLTDSKFFTATANLGYAFGIFLLLLVFPFHSRVKGTESIIRFGSAFQLQPADLCKLFVNLALAKYLSRVETNFTRPRSQLIAPSLSLYRPCSAFAKRDRPCPGLFLLLPGDVPGRAAPFRADHRLFFSVLVVATLLMEPNTLALVLTGIAVAAIYFLRRVIKRNRAVLFLIVGIWFVCVGVQRFVVPFVFDHVFQPYQVKRIYDAIGKDYVPKGPGYRGCPGE